MYPSVYVSFGVGAGATAGNSKNSNSGGGVGGKVSPTAVLVISNGTTKMVNVKSADSLTKILDMVPDFVNRFTNKGGDPGYGPGFCEPLHEQGRCFRGS